MARRQTTLTARATLLAAVIGVLVLTLAYPLRLYLQQRQELVDVVAQNAEKQQRVDELRDAAARYEDPSWVEDEVRRRLYYLRPGEQAFLMPTEEEPSAPPPADTGAAAGRTVWYGRLWTQLAEAQVSEAETPTSAPVAP